MARQLPFSPTLLVSYILDWIIIIGIAAVGGAFWKQHPFHRPFSPVDPNLSYPYKPDSTVPTYALALAALVAPAIITAILALVLPSASSSQNKNGSTHTNGLLRVGGTRTQGFVHRLWEWNVAWMGLALGLVLTFLFTEGMKNTFGKPRPDLLSRCNPDPTSVQRYKVGGGFGVSLPEWNLLISSDACRQADRSILDDGFESFPSGHASFSWAGLLYLSLYLASRLRAAIPSSPPYSSSAPHLSSPSTAAPPTYTLIPPLVPICVATYISATRFTDFRHHGFDILFGAIMGSVFAWTAFRFYHAPIRRGGGWSWGPRPAGMGAFFVNKGNVSWGEDTRKRDDDVEAQDRDRGLGFQEEENGSGKRLDGSSRGEDSGHS